MVPDFGSRDFPTFVDRLIQVLEDDFAQVHEHLLAGEKYLCNSDIDMTIPVNQAAAVQLRDWTIDVIQPTNAFAEEAPFTAGKFKWATEIELNF
ncbi:MAG: hypothetical protein Q9179_002126 [Wetmoreana sp. 5 TL-2023]